MSIGPFIFLAVFYIIGFTGAIVVLSRILQWIRESCADPEVFFREFKAKNPRWERYSNERLQMYLWVFLAIWVTILLSGIFLLAHDIARWITT